MARDRSGSTVAGAPRGGLPRYRFSLRFTTGWLASAVRGRRRDLVADGRREVLRHAPLPQLGGAERLPSEGPFLLVVNHYERPGMRMWWTAWTATVLLAERGRGARIRWLSTTSFRGWHPFGVTLVPDAVVRRFLRLVARTYALIPVDPRSPRQRSRALREAYRALHHEGRSVGIAPEAGNAPGLSRQLIRGVPESGAAVAWLSRGIVPIVPMALWEGADGRVVAVVGEPYTLEQPRADLGREEQQALTDRVMRSVAVLLPKELRGYYRQHSGRNSEQA